MRAGPALLGEICPCLPEISADWADFFHINSAARPDIVHNINFKRTLVHWLNFEAGWRRTDNGVRFKFFFGGEGVVDGEGVAVKDAWSGVVGVIKGFFQKNILKQEVGKGGGGKGKVVHGGGGLKVI